MKTLLLLIIISNLALAAETPKSKLEKEVSINFGKPPTDEQNSQVTDFIIKLKKKLRENAQFNAELLSYYKLMRLKETGSMKWVDFNNAGITQVSPETTTWVKVQYLNDEIKAKEDYLAMEIQKVIIPYLVVNKYSFKNGPVVSSIVTYNERTMPTKLLQLVLPVQEDNLLKTHLVINLDKEVSSSILLTYKVLGSNVDIKAKDVRKEVIDNEVKKKLADLD